QIQARRLLAAYIKLRTERRPWVICKWAQTSDGLVELGEDQGKWISGAQSRGWVHKLRGRCEGICVGIGTVLADDPLLTDRSALGRHPIRVVLDCGLGIPLDSQLVRSGGEVPLIVATSAEALTANPTCAEQLMSAGVELLELPAAEGRLHLPALLDELGRRGWTYLLVEGGPTVLEGFIDSDLTDELLVFVSPPKDVPAPETLRRFDIAELRRRRQLGEPQLSRIGDDTLLRFVLSSY
ncbi:MAG: RibD family protein, partial [Phycisphaerae bacterium]|nr:RibD family protein [Phycisphaerae bacterium]